MITIFPGYLVPLREALLGRAIENGLIELAVHDLRDWTHDVHQAVDDAPYGGGPGMVMRPQVWGEALDAVIAEVHEAVLTKPMSRATWPVVDSSLLVAKPSAPSVDFMTGRGSSPPG